MNNIWMDIHTSHKLTWVQPYIRIYILYMYTHRCMFFTHSILINVSASAFIYDLMCITMHTVTSMPFTDAEHA